MRVASAGRASVSRVELAPAKKGCEQISVVWGRSFSGLFRASLINPLFLFEKKWQLRLQLSGDCD
jgi:hypothetical protein